MNFALHIRVRNGKFVVGSTMLTWAKPSDQKVESGNGTLKMLLSMKNRNGKTSLLEVILNDHPKMVAMMLRVYPKIANIVNDSLEIPLFLAVYININFTWDTHNGISSFADLHSSRMRTTLDDVAVCNMIGKF